MVFGNKDLSDWCVHCYLGIIAYRTSQQTETEICMYTRTHPYIYVSMFKTWVQTNYAHSDGLFPFYKCNSFH